MTAEKPPGAPPSDEELACRAQQGCTASFEELARRLQVPLVHFLRMHAGPEDAEDLAQDALIRAYRKLDRYQPKWRFATWLFTIARRLSMNAARRRRPSLDCQALEHAHSPSPEPHELVAEADDRRRLWSLAAEVLTEQQLSAVWLFYVEQLPVKEVARIVGCSRVAVRALLFRARKRLLESLPPGQSGKEGRGGASGAEQPRDATGPDRQGLSEMDPPPEGIEVNHG
jgi:RNA polymerase sigma-70 factor, ECF subfamily